MSVVAAAATANASSRTGLRGSRVAAAAAHSRHVSPRTAVAAREGGARASMHPTSASRATRASTRSRSSPSRHNVCARVTSAISSPKASSNRRKSFRVTARREDVSKARSPRRGKRSSREVSWPPSYPPDPVDEGLSTAMRNLPLARHVADPGLRAPARETRSHARAAASADPDFPNATRAANPSPLGNPSPRDAGPNARA